MTLGKRAVGRGRPGSPGSPLVPRVMRVVLVMLDMGLIGKVLGNVSQANAQRHRYFLKGTAMCTRAVYIGEDGLVITGRSMDWAEDMHSNAWSFPRGMERDGASGPNAIKWTSRYGSLVFSAYDVGSADGMNEKGLVMNGLYLAESDYGTADERPTISILGFGQYVLDMFGTVAEAVEALKGDHIHMVAPDLPNGKATTVHLSLSDPSGDSAIFEFLDGKLVVHHGSEYRVMTNSPRYEEQLAIDTYWKGIDPMTFLPGSFNAADRFARVSFMIGAIPTAADSRILSASPDQRYENQAAASVMSVMRAAGVPLGVTHPTKPNLASTLWRTVHDHSRLMTFFDSASTPNTFWIPLDDLDLSEGAPVRKLTIAGGKVYSGNATSAFEEAEPFPFLQG